MEKSVTHMAKKATNEVKMKELKRIGYLTVLILTLILTLPAYGGEPITNAGKALLSGVDLGGKHEVIEKRTKASKTFVNPDGSFTLVTGIKPIHYQDAHGKWKEIDTRVNAKSPVGSAFRAPETQTRGELIAGRNPDAHHQTDDDYTYQMTENSWHVYFKERFNDGPVLKYEHDGEWVTITPAPLTWVGQYGQQELIAMPQGKEAAVSANTISYPESYGPGLGMRYLLVPERIVKELIIRAKHDLPPPTSFASDEAHLDLSFAFAYSENLELWVGDKRWDGSSDVVAVEKGDVVFVKEGKTLFFWRSPEFHDSSGTLGEGNHDIYGHTAYYLSVTESGTSRTATVHVRVPWRWLDSVVYPVYVDPTFTTQPNAAAGQDTQCGESGWSALYTYGSDTTVIIYGSTIGWHMFIRWDLSSIPAGSTVTSATMTLYKTNTETWTDSNNLVCYELTDANGDWQEDQVSYSYKNTGSSIAWAGSQGCNTAGTDYKTPSMGTFVFQRNVAGTKDASLNTSVVAGWLGQSTNNGMICRTSGAPVLDIATSDHGTASWRPMLVVVYTPPALDQEGFRFRYDDGSEILATWLANQDIDITRAKNTNTRLRVIVNATLDPASKQYQLEYKKSADTVWKKVEAPSGSIAWGTTGTAAVGTNSLLVPYPASIAAGDLLVLAIANKYPTNGPSTPAGWTAPANCQGSGGSGSAGPDIGSVYSTIFVKEADGTESGSLSVTITSGNSAVGRMLRYTKGTGKTWSYACTNGADNTAGLAWSVTGAADPGIAGGDMVVVASAVNTDAYSYSVEAVSATGITFGTQVERFESGTTQGDDCELVVSDHVANSGTSSAAPVFTMTASGTTTNVPAGASSILRIRQVDQPIQLSLSTNFADGDSTTAQLSAPSGKTTSNFTAGKMQESTNSAAVDIANNYYTELEWCLKATDAAEDGQTYQFRVTAAGTVLNTYSVTPQWSIPGVPFEYRRQITIDYTKVSPCTSNLFNFPVLISESGTWLRTKPDGNIYNSNGWDIIFTDSTGTIQLDHEIEKYDGTNGVLVAWVRIPTLSQTANTIIYMYYGNNGITSATANPTGVWSNGYVGVWHLKETAGGAGAIKNSSANAGLDGTDSGSPTFNATGQIDGAISFNGSNRIAITDPGTGSVLDFGTGTSITLSAWIKPSSVSGFSTILIKNDSDGTAYANYAWQFSSTLDFNYYNTTNSRYNEYITTSSVLAAGSWYHTVVTYTFGTANSAIIYVNGASKAGSWTSGISTGTPRQANDQLWFANDVAAEPFTGILDEVRISSVARDACWIGTEYNNQVWPNTAVTPSPLPSPNPGGGFITVGAEVQLAPTAVKLTSFIATEYSGGVLLRWKTGYEVSNLGFHVYREEDGEPVRLTPEPVAGSALMAGKGTRLGAGHSYFWWDPSLSPQSSLGSVRYWLKDIDLSGKETMHGPVTPALSREPVPEKFRPELLSEVGLRLQERYHHYWKVQELKERIALKRLEVRGPLRSRITPAYAKSASAGRSLEAASILKARRASTLSPQSSSLDTIKMQQSLASRPAVKILVREEGWYRVSQPELVVAGLSPKANPRYLQLYVDGREEPIQVIGKREGVFGPGDAIEFYGVGLDTPSTDTRVYWLVEGLRPGKRIDEFRGYSGSLGSLSSSSYPHTIEKKDRTVYFAALRNGDEGNFFGPLVYPAVQADQVLNIWHLDPGASEDALLEVALQGVTTVAHRVKVLVNETEVGKMVFEGQSRGIVSLPVSQSLLEEGENLVSLVAEGGEMDASVIDTIRLTYWHTYTAEDNALKFTAQGGELLRLSGFSHPRIRVIDITEPGDVIEVIGKVESEKGGYAISFRVPEHQQRTLLTLTEERVKAPEGIILDHPSSWHQVRDGYDFVIISYRDFLGSLLPLKALRESQGFSVALIDIEDLYDEFSFGVKSPKAIKDFLTLTKANWRRPPRYVLLVGDASYDPRNYLGLGNFDLVPTKLVDTVYFETASDDWFVDFNNDGLPEMAVGRLPVQKAEEAAIIVSKIVGYERSSRTDEALLVADRVDNPNDFNFEGASEEVGALLPSSLMVRKIYRSQFSGDDIAKGEFIKCINEGPLLVNFIGHGSIGIWRGSILTSQDAETLTNVGLPFFVGMTCLNGYFQDIYMESLAESLLKAPQGGAVAVWTSSGLTEPDKQAVMNKELIKLLFGRESLTLGEATARAKASISDSDIRRTWILFGDPTTRLK